MVFVCLLMAFMFAEYGDSFYMIKAYNEGYKEIQKAYQPKDYEEKMDDPGSGLDKLLEKAGISLNDKGGMNVIAKRGSLGGLVKGLQQKRGMSCSSERGGSSLKTRTIQRPDSAGYSSSTKNGIFIILLL